jgi:hypothetical protein
LILILTDVSREINFRNKLIFYGEELLAPLPTPKLEDHSLSAVRHCLFKIFAATEEHRLRVFENRVLRRIFDPKRDEVTGDWRELHNEELRNLYSSHKHN